MDDLQRLLDNNEKWATESVKRDPNFFKRLVGQQNPQYLWIGCSDSRVPANEILGLLPGEVFVHRNVANVVVHSDLNCLSVLQFAVDVLKVRHIIVCGHYGCSGVHVAQHEKRVGMADLWLGHVRDVAGHYHHLLEREAKDSHKDSLLCELNVLEQALNVVSSPVVLDAWNRGQELSVHGWIYSLRDGRIRHLNFSADRPQDIPTLRRKSVDQLMAARDASIARKKAGGS